MFPGAEELRSGTYDDDQGTVYLEVMYQTPEGTTNSDILEFFVRELRDSWCYETHSAYHYENEPDLVDGEGLNAVFQARGSTVLLATRHAADGGEVYELDVGPTYERDPDIDNCQF